jgi:hypothetical protein
MVQDSGGSANYFLNLGFSNTICLGSPGCGSAEFPTNVVCRGQEFPCVVTVERLDRFFWANEIVVAVKALVAFLAVDRVAFKPRRAEVVDD